MKKFVADDGCSDPDCVWCNAKRIAIKVSDELAGKNREVVETALGALIAIGSHDQKELNESLLRIAIAAKVVLARSELVDASDVANKLPA